MARPTPNNPNGEQISPVMTPEVIQKLEVAFSMGANQKEACLHANIRESTYSTWKARKPELANDLERLRSKPVLLARFSLIKGIESDPRLALQYLERVNRDEFSLRSENVNTNVTLEQVLSHFQDPDNLNEEEDESEVSGNTIHQE